MLRAKKGKKAPIRTQKIQPKPPTVAVETINLNDLQLARTLRNKTTALLSSFLHMPDIAPIGIDQSLLTSPVIVKGSIDYLKVSRKIPEKIIKPTSFKSSEVNSIKTHREQIVNAHKGLKKEREAMSFPYEVPPTKIRSPLRQAPRVHDSFVMAQGSLPKPRVTVAGKRPPGQKPFIPEQASLKIESSFFSRPEKKSMLNSQHSLPRCQIRDNELMYKRKIPSSISSTTTPPNLQVEEYKQPYKHSRWR